MDNLWFQKTTITQIGPLQYNNVQQILVFTGVARGFMIMVVRGFMIMPIVRPAGSKRLDSTAWR